MRSAVGLAVLSAAAVISGCGSSAIGPQSHPSPAARATPSVAGPRNAHELTVRAVRASRVRVRAGVDGLVAAYGAMWVSGSGAVTRLDASTGRVVAGIRTPGVNELGYIAAGRGSVWATATGNGDVYRIDPSTNQVAATIHVGGPVVGIAVGAGQVWVSRPASALGNVVRIDPHTDRVTGDPITVGRGPGQLAYGLGSVWVQNTSPASVMRIDPANGHVTTVVGTRPVAYGSFVVGAIATGDGSLWTAANDSLTRIDPRTDQVLATVHIPRAISVAIGDGSVWVLTQPKSRSPKLFYPIKHTAALWEVDPATDRALGKVLRLNAIGPAAITATHRSLQLWIADYQSNSVTRFRLIHSILSGHSRTRSTTPTAQVPTPAAVRPLTSILAIMRRPQTNTDINPALREQLQRESHDRFDLGFFGTPIITLVRLAAVAPWGQRIYLIPHLPPTRQQIAKLPAKWRQGGTRVTHATTISVFFYPMSSGAVIPAVIKGGRAWDSDSKRGSDYSGDRYVFVFPDGVTKVELWPSTSTRAHPHPLVPAHAKPITVTVHNNVAAFQARRFGSPGREIWHGPSGKIVKRIANASSCAPPLGNCA
jgi:YVTN family beta-propeller protein